MNNLLANGSVPYGTLAPTGTVDTKFSFYFYIYIYIYIYIYAEPALEDLTIYISAQQYYNFDMYIWCIVIKWFSLCTTGMQAAKAATDLTSFLLLILWISLNHIAQFISTMNVRQNHLSPTSTGFPNYERLIIVWSKHPLERPEGKIASTAMIPLSYIP